MNLPIDKEYNNIYSFSKLSETDTDEDRIKQHLYYDYTRVNGFQFLSSNNIEKTINLGFDLELNINYDVDYSEIIKYNYCVVQDKKFGTNNQKKKYFYFISNIRQSNSVGKYKITLRYDYWSNNIAIIYLNNFENTFNFSRKSNSLKYSISGNNINLEVPNDYRLSSLSNKLPAVSRKPLNITINNYGYTILFAKIFLKSLGYSKFYENIYYDGTVEKFNYFNCTSQYFPGQFVLFPFCVFDYAGNVVSNPKIKVLSSSDTDGTMYDTYNLDSINDVFRYISEYVDFIELTSVVPFINTGIISNVDEDNNIFTLNSYFRSAKLATTQELQPSQPIPKCPYVIITNYFDLGSTQKSFPVFSDGNIIVENISVPKIIDKNDLRKFVVESNRYPYKYKGLQIATSDFPCYSVDGVADYEFIIKANGLGFTIFYNVSSNGKDLNAGILGNIPSKDVFYLPSYGDNFINFMLGNKNQLDNTFNQIQINSLTKEALGAITAIIGVATANPTLIVGGSLGLISSAAGGVSETINAQNSIDAKIEDAKNALNSLKGNNNGLTSLYTTNIPIFYESLAFDTEEVDFIAFDVYTKGSKYNGITNIKDIVNKCKYYNYIQTNVEILPFNSVDKISLDELTKIFNKGVRIWNINDAEYKKEGSNLIYIDETFATMNLLIFNYREKEN